MGKRIISQRRGKGSPTYRTRPLATPRLSYDRKKGKVMNIVRYTLKKAPVALVMYEDGTKRYMAAPEGVKVGDDTESFLMPLSKVPVGERVFGIEAVPNGGPKFCLSPGSSAVLLSREGKRVKLKMPSKTERLFNADCLAVVGVPAGEGRGEKPFMLAGRRFKLMKSVGRLYPRTSACKMNAVDHPFGGGKKRPPVSRNAPPGAKVGSIAAKRKGRRKR
jgi:large subunit ribosomal protein L2